MAEQVSDQVFFPVIRYRDPDAAIEWLGRAFGLTERVVYRDDSGKVMHAELELDGSMIMLGQADPAGWMGGGAPQPLGSTVSLYVVIEDPDAHHDRAVAAGATVVRELERPELRLTRVQRPRPRGKSLVVRDLQPAGIRRVSEGG